MRLIFYERYEDSSEHKPASSQCQRLDTYSNLTHPVTTTGNRDICGISVSDLPEHSMAVLDMCSGKQSPYA